MLSYKHDHSAKLPANCIWIIAQSKRMFGISLKNWLPIILQILSSNPIRVITVRINGNWDSFRGGISAHQASSQDYSLASSIVGRDKAEQRSHSSLFLEKKQFRDERHERLLFA